MMLERILLDILLKRDEIKKKFSRILPFGDYLNDRWEKAKYCGFGEGSSVYDNCLILGKVKVGKQTWIGPNTVLDGSGGELMIGNNCDISAGVQIYTHDTVDRVRNNKEVKKANTTIGNNVYIGPNTVISKGLKIGNHVVIGANSFVNCDIPNNCNAYGSPVSIRRRKFV